MSTLKAEHLHLLPIELVLDIATYLSFYDVIRLVRTCKRFQKELYRFDLSKGSGRDTKQMRQIVDNTISQIFIFFNQPWTMNVVYYRNGLMLPFTSPEDIGLDDFHQYGYRSVAELSDFIVDPIKLIRYNKSFHGRCQAWYERSTGCFLCCQGLFCINMRAKRCKFALCGICCARADCGDRKHAEHFKSTITYKQLQSPT